MYENLLKLIEDKKIELCTIEQIFNINLESISFNEALDIKKKFFPEYSIEYIFDKK